MFRQILCSFNNRAKANEKKNCKLNPVFFSMFCADTYFHQRGHRFPNSYYQKSAFWGNSPKKGSQKPSCLYLFSFFFLLTGDAVNYHLFRCHLSDDVDHPALVSRWTPTTDYQKALWNFQRRCLSQRFGLAALRPTVTGRFKDGRCHGLATKCRL